MIGTQRSVLCVRSSWRRRQKWEDQLRSPVTAQKEAFATTYLILLFLKVYVVSRDVESRSTNSIHHHHLHVSSGTVRKISQSSSCCNGSAVSMKWSVRRSHPRHRHQPHFQAAADAHSCSRSESRRRKQPVLVATSGKDEDQTPIKNSPR